MDYDIVDQRSSFTPSPLVPLWKDIWTRAPFSLLFLLFTAVAVFLSQVYSHWKEQRATTIAWLEQRRRAGIPDSDKRPWNIAYADAQRRISEQNATQRRQDPDMSATNSVQSFTRRSSFRSRRPSFASRRSSFNSGSNTPRPSTPRVSSQHFHFGSAFPEPARSPRYVSNMSPLRFDSRPTTPALRESTPSIFGGSVTQPRSSRRFSTIRSPSPSLSRYDDRASEYGSNQLLDISLLSESIPIEPSTNSIFVPHSEFKPRQPAYDSESTRLAYMQKRGPAFSKRAAELLESQSENSAPSSKKRQRIGQDSVLDQGRAPKRPASENGSVFESGSESEYNMSQDVPPSSNVPKKSKLAHAHGNSSEPDDFVMVDSDSIPTIATKQDRRSSVIPGGLFDVDDIDVDMESQQNRANDDEGSLTKKRDIDQVDSSNTNPGSTSSLYPPTKSPKKSVTKSPKLTSTTNFSEVQNIVDSAKSPFTKSSQRVPTWIPWSPIKRKPGDRWENEDGDQFTMDADGKERTLVQVKQWRHRKDRMPAKWSNEEEANIPEKTLIAKWLTQEEFEKAQKLNMLGGQPDVDVPAKSTVDDWNSTLEADTSSIYYRRGTGTPLGRGSSSIALSTRKSSSSSPKQKNSVSSTSNGSGPGPSRLRDTSRPLMKSSKSMRALPRPATAAERQEAELSNPKRRVPSKHVQPSLQQTSSTPSAVPSMFGAPPPSTAAPSAIPAATPNAATSGISVPNNNNTPSMFGTPTTSSNPASIFGAPASASASSTSTSTTAATATPSFAIAPLSAPQASSTATANTAPTFSFGQPPASTVPPQNSTSKPSLFGASGSTLAPLNTTAATTPLTSPAASAGGTLFTSSPNPPSQANSSPSLFGNTLVTAAPPSKPSFSFGATNSTTNNASAAVTTGNTSTTPSFAFGNITPASNGFGTNTTSSPGFNLGGGTGASSFSFGQQKQQKQQQPATQTQAQISAPASTFSFGSNTTDTNTNKIGAFSFGKDTATNAAPSAFSFGQSTAPPLSSAVSNGSGSNTPTLTISGPSSPALGATTGTPMFSPGSTNKPLTTPAKPRRPRSSRH